MSMCFWAVRFHQDLTAKNCICLFACASLRIFVSWNLEKALPQDPTLLLTLWLTPFSWLGFRTLFF